MAELRAQPCFASIQQLRLHACEEYADLSAFGELSSLATPIAAVQTPIFPSSSTVGIHYSPYVSCYGVPEVKEAVDEFMDLSVVISRPV